MTATGALLWTFFILAPGAQLQRMEYALLYQDQDSCEVARSMLPKQRRDGIVCWPVPGVTFFFQDQEHDTK